MNYPLIFRNQSCFKQFTVQAKLEVPQHPDIPEKNHDWILLLSTSSLSCNLPEISISSAPQKL